MYNITLSGESRVQVSGMVYYCPEVSELLKATIQIIWSTNQYGTPLYFITRVISYGKS